MNSDTPQEPKMQSFKVEASESGYEVEAKFERDGTSVLAGLAAEILSNPAAPNYCVFEVWHDEVGKFEVTVQKVSGKSITQAMNDLRNTLHNYQVTVERAIAEGHNSLWIRDEVDRLSKRIAS